MRYTVIGLLCLIAVGGAATAPVSPATADIRGIATVGVKPEGNVVVWVDAPGAPAKAGPKPVLEQRNMAFFPRVLVVQVGTVVEFPNRDRVLHNVFSFHNGKKFDLGVYPTGSLKRVTFDQPGLSRLLCNIHPHMTGYVMAVDSPYFALSDDAGRFVIRDVPTGTHKYYSWKPGADSPVAATAALGPGKVLEVKWQ